jgi:hypothetical protein
MKVLPTIKGRKAIPVRAIPYVTGWKGPRGISPDMVARSLGQHPNDRRPFSAMQTLSAYSLHLGKPVEVRQASWRMVAVQLDGLSAQIEAQFPNDRKGKRNKQSLAAWHTRAIELLPKGVFVWLDEFEKEYLRYFDFQSHATLLEYPGERDLDLTLVAMTEKEWEVVMQGFDTQEVTWQDASVVTKSASDGMEPGKAGPLSLTTGDIAFCFAGLRWKTQDEWKKLLGNNDRKWLHACVVTPGMRGGNPKLWDPVCIGAAIVGQGYASARSVRARFQREPLLKPWEEDWKTYEADNFSTE